MPSLRALIPKPVKRLVRRALARANTPDDIVRQFHQLFYDRVSTTWNNTFWMGIRALKNPLDLWIYQEIIFEMRPDVIVETGTCHGGSAFYLASICDLVGHGHVVSIDIEPGAGRPQHPRITYLVGSSVAEPIVREVETLIQNKTVMVTLDSDHQQSHVMAEMRLYSRYVTKGHYMIVEDTNVNGHPVYSSFGPGPMEAVEEFLKEDAGGFQIDEERQKFLLTFHPKGFLKKIK